MNSEQGRALFRVSPILLLTLAACSRSNGYEVILDTTPAPTTTYVSEDTATIRAWFDSLTDLQKFSACDNYLAFVSQADVQAFVDWVMLQGASEPQAWTIAGVLGEKCVERHG